MKRTSACFLMSMMLCGSAFAGLESDKAGSGLKFRESAGSSRFSSHSGGGSGGVYIGGGSSSRSKSARRPSAAAIARSRTGSKKLGTNVPPPKTQQPSAPAGKQSILAKAGKMASKAANAVGSFASKAVKAATSPTGKKVLLAGAATLAIGGAMALTGGAAAGVPLGTAVMNGSVIMGNGIMHAGNAILSSLAFQTVQAYLGDTKEAH
ncbi:MAG: hypothetical protein WC421_03155 [Elusimicrobiales bacterium]